MKTNTMRIEPVLTEATIAQPLAFAELGHADAADARAALDMSTNPLHHIKTQLQVCLGDVTLTVGELLNARENEVLVLDRLVDQPVDLLLEGRVVARGQLIAVDEQFAVRITELPVQLKV
jgi:flagellar motor switch protein FliN/FliY